MSRPGYPIIINRTVQLHGEYQEPAPPNGGGGSGSAETTESYLSRFADKVGENSPGFPANKPDNTYGHLAYWRDDEFATETGQQTTMFPVTFSQDWAFRSLSSWDPRADWVGSAQYFQEDDAIASKLINKLIDNIQNSKTNVAQFIAERRQTANLVASTARRIAASIVALRRGDISHAIVSLTGSNSKVVGRKLRHISGIPEQFLALKFGWQPLLGDIYGSAEELANLTTRNPPVLRATGMVKVMGSPFEKRLSPNDDFGRFPPTRWVRSKGHIVGHGMLEYRLSSDFGQMVGRTGILDPWTLAWELLPWSFVADWFIPVGSFLGRLQYDSGIVFSRGYLNYKRLEEWQGSCLARNASHDWGGYTSSWSGGKSRGRLLVFNRTALSSSPLPPGPRFKDPFSPTHVAEALSLLSTALTGNKSGLRLSKF